MAGLGGGARSTHHGLDGSECPPYEAFDELAFRTAPRQRLRWPAPSTGKKKIERTCTHGGTHAPPHSTQRALFAGWTARSQEADGIKYSE